jgi:hypothetical protein
MHPATVRPCKRLAALALAALLPAACATMDGAAGEPDIPAGAVEATRTESNGDTVTEYRVNGALAMVRIVPARGVTYYLMDADGDGRLDRTPHGTRDTPVYFKLYGW